MKKRKEAISRDLLQPGMTVADNRYRVDEIIGDNGLTITYKGYDSFRKMVVVIRELFPSAILKRDYGDYILECKKLSEEALFLSMKEHMISKAKKMIKLYPLEGVSNVLTYLEERNTVYIIEEYVHGMTLEQMLFNRHSSKFTVADLSRYLFPVMQVVSYIHEKGMFHGSICPQNILITRNHNIVLLGMMNPVEDVACDDLKNPSIRMDAYSPVELYLPEAKKQNRVDIYEVGAIFYRYVTGQELPAYYDRINEGKETLRPDEMQTRAMKFESDAIMKAVSIYDFDRFETMQDFQQALCPPDVDRNALYTAQETGKNLRRKPFWYMYEQKKLRRYRTCILLLLVIGCCILGPELHHVAQDMKINRFYRTFNEATLYEQCEMLADLSEKERNLYTNDYVDMDASMTDEQRSKALVAKYYDFQLTKYVTAAKMDRDQQYYQYMRIDLRTNKAMIVYLTDTGSSTEEINLKKISDGSYQVSVITLDDGGNDVQEIVYAKP